MTALTLSNTSPTAVDADAVVIGVAKGEAGPVLAPGSDTAAAVAAAFGDRLAATLDILGAKGGEEEVTKLPAPDGLAARLVLAVGLGAAPEPGRAAEDGEASADPSGDAGDDAGEAAPAYSHETLRRAAGAAARALTGVEHAAFALPTADPAAVAAVAEGALLGAYSFTAFRGAEHGRGGKAAKGGKAGGSGTDDAAEAPARDAGEPLAAVTLLTPRAEDPAHRAAADRAVVLAAEVARARDLINTPANALSPADFAAAAQAAAKEHGLKVEVLDEQALAKGGYGGILGVGRGSAAAPRLVRLSYTHGRASASLALVGKGITYDSGGLSLKPVGANETMKCDMSGAAAVFATVLAAARLGLRVNVTGWLALAENMPSGSATRPGDVLHMYSGKTVEVLNTDAEGRLVLADAMARACEESPDALVDVATLTGAMMVALGKRTFGVLGNDDAFRDLVHETAEEVGEQSWPMPMPAELREDLKSSVADVSNVGGRLGGGLSAAVFLKEFVPDGTRWAHLDIAGSAFNDGAPHGYTHKGGTGVSVRTLLRLAERAAAGELGR